jgi:hypothetical protein
MTWLVWPHSLAPTADLEVSALSIPSVAECLRLVERGESFQQLALLPHLKRRASIVVRNGHGFAVAPDAILFLHDYCRSANPIHSCLTPTDEN